MLSVIVPDKRPGMQAMLARELNNKVVSEVIYAKWETGLKKAKGDFVLLLEKDSAIKKGSIENQLKPFLENPLFRKLAMVSPLVEFDDMEQAIDVSDAEKQFNEYSETCLTRIGSAAGSIIRRSSLIQHMPGGSFTLMELSQNLSLNFWEHGLRVMLDPKSVYYSPSANQYRIRKLMPASDIVTQLWQRECIA